MNKILLLILSLVFSPMANAECAQATVYFDQAIVYKKDKHYEQALNGFNQAAQLCPAYQVFYQQGLALIKLNRFDDALNCFKTALNYSEKNSKDEANALARIALIHIQQKSLQQASAFIEEAYSINKENSSNWILRLRKAIDLQSLNYIVSAAEINQVISSTKSFAVRPKITFNSITFKFNSTEFTSDSQRQITELGKALAKTNQQTLLIGHTDKIGEATYNMRLSKRRAEAVKKALVSKYPVLISTLHTNGMGEEDLKYLGSSEADHQLNRRVEMQWL